MTDFPIEVFDIFSGPFDILTDELFLIQHTGSEEISGQVKWPIPVPVPMSRGSNGYHDTSMLCPTDVWNADLWEVSEDYYTYRSVYFNATKYYDSITDESDIGAMMELLILFDLI